ncbi:gliding motility-associated C-terminal domain-containing protein [Taibaiella chishuiensis]|uniref:Gliding motility-associated-like protein n=1 Tax=Taibaiella chishuiensis TaxID=1434707 RepID=A0A2P8CZJ9_9BACT|nr:gliding motility-associated C-terminal domain-containing protein [Taibaiella chishuiensis]PSK90408.1 gliding motility-associated-like protein [Taibaiella chishuiensis]
MYRYVLLLAAGICCCLIAGAQKENNQWVFGHQTGLNFNSGAPVFFQTQIATREGAASVSDKEGHLLFYSNGNKVWNGLHNVMPNGDGLLGNGSNSPLYPGSSTQGVAIVQSPQNAQQYYVFVLDALEETIFSPFLPAYLRYSIVDMSLNNGLGDVIATQKNRVVDSGIAEQMCIARGLGCSYWLIVHQLTTPVYKAFRIDAQGIHAPVLSTGIYRSIFSGEMKVSPDETKIAMTVNTLPDTFTSAGAIELGGFDKATGSISNVVLVDRQNTGQKYGLSFSPDSRKLYSGNAPYELVQLDVSTYPDTASINNSKVSLGTGHFGGMRTGPDLKIYIAPIWPGTTAYISRINDPNQAGLACNLDTIALAMPATSFFPATGEVGLGLGTPLVLLRQGMEEQQTHTFALCPGDSVQLAADAGYTNFSWEDGSTLRERTIRNTGLYWVTEKQECAVLVDSFRVTLTDTLSGIREGDTTLCVGAPLSLHAFAGTQSGYSWSSGSAGDSITVTEDGVYRLQVTNSCGTFYDSVRVGFVECVCHPFMPNAFSPNRDGLNDVLKPRIACPLSFYLFSVYNRYGQRVFASFDPGKGWDGTFQGKDADQGTYFYHIRYTSVQGVSYVLKGDLSLIR